MKLSALLNEGIKTYKVDDVHEEKKSEKSPSLKPPKGWFRKGEASIKRKNPSYSKKKIDAILGSVWYHKMSKKERSKTRRAEGKTYGKAPTSK